MSQKTQPPFDWTQSTPDELAVLNALQAVSAPAHTRMRVMHLEFSGADPFARRRAIRRLAHLLTTAYQHLRDTARATRTVNRVQAPATVTLALTHAGYLALGCTQREAPAGRLFRTGLGRTPHALASISAKDHDILSDAADQITQFVLDPSWVRMIDDAVLPATADAWGPTVNLPALIQKRPRGQYAAWVRIRHTTRAHQEPYAWVAGALGGRGLCACDSSPAGRGGRSQRRGVLPAAGDLAEKRISAFTVSQYPARRSDRATHHQALCQLQRRAP